jgi:hypothetical protein
VFCKNGGETLDFGEGPHFVRDSSEKRRYMEKHGVSEAQGHIPRPQVEKPKKSFEQHFYEEHGTDLG